MERLIEGVHRFHHDQFGNYRSLFRKLSQEGAEIRTRCSSPARIHACWPN
ncbi:MAG: hypothetical protein WDN00_08330 [Limisphaerales bacterium]